MKKTDTLALLRADEKTAAWLEHVEQIDPPPRAVTIPDDEDFLLAMRDLGIEPQDCHALEVLRGEIVASPDLMWLLGKCVQSLRLHMDMVDAPPPFPALPEEMGETGRCFYAFVSIAMLPFTLGLHRSRGIPDDISRATLADLGRNMNVHRLKFGSAGLVSPNWNTRHARGLIFQLGRLQFERGRIGNRMSEAIQAAGLPFGQGDPCLEVHIPAHMGPMTPEACDESFAQAREFFPRRFPEEAPKIAVCSSWLLDEQLAEYLPESSNILQFQRRFRRAYRPEANNGVTLEFVFRMATSNLDELPQDTTLERAVVRHIRDGRQWHGGAGWLDL